MSETCCMRLAENTGCKKSPEISHLRTIAQLCQDISLQLRHVSTIGKNLFNSNISPTCPHNMVNFSPLVAEFSSLVWGTPANFNGFRVLASLLQRRRSMEANLCTLFGHLLGWYAISCPVTKFSRCKIHFVSSKSCALYW